MRILVTGAAGYIGSHAALRLVEEGHEVLLLDNLVRGHKAAAERIVGLARPGQARFVQAEAGDADAVEAAMRAHGTEAVLHFAALAYVGESVDQPVRYWRTNLGGTVGLLEAMDRVGVRRLVFSSTCATYGVPGPEHRPISERCPQAPVNPYGASKLASEWAISAHAEACARKGQEFAHAFLRYFNVAGSDRKCRIGEDHRPESHLVPSAILAALGRRGPLQVFGRDWPTPDGTCIRDYVHVEDLIDAHLAVLGRLEPGKPRVFNVGNGVGYSVLQVLKSCERACGKPVPVEDAPRRAGDPPELVAAPSRIQQELGWKARILDMDEVCASAARWFERNPAGYG